MKALFLAGGMGTRLRPLTDSLPKPMIPIMEIPLLEQSINQLVNFGIHEYIISVHYQSQVIEKYFKINKAGMKIHILFEEKPLGTAGAIRNAQDLLDDTFLVLNADILADINLHEMYQQHIRKRALVTIAVIKMTNPSAYGVINVNNNGYVTSFIEKPQLECTSSQNVNAGIYLIDPVVLQEVPDNRIVSMERELFPLLIEKGIPLSVFSHSHYWQDIGTPERYLQAHFDILDGKMTVFNVNFNGNRQFISNKSFIHPTAKILGPVYIGDNVVIEANAIIGPYAVIYANSHIGSDVKVHQSVIWPSIDVKGGSTIIDSVVCSTCDKR